MNCQELGKEIIFGKTRERALAKLEELYQEILDSKDEFLIRRTMDRIETNKRTINAMSISHSSRGYKCEKAYVDWSVSIGLLKYVIEPCCYPRAYKDGKFNIEMFGDVR